MNFKTIETLSGLDKVAQVGQAARGVASALGRGVSAEGLNASTMRLLRDALPGEARALVGPSARAVLAGEKSPEQLVRLADELQSGGISADRYRALVGDTQVGELPGRLRTMPQIPETVSAHPTIGDMPRELVDAPLGGGLPTGGAASDIGLDKAIRQAVAERQAARGSVMDELRALLGGDTLAGRSMDAPASGIGTAEYAAPRAGIPENLPRFPLRRTAQPGYSAAGSRYPDLLGPDAFGPAPQAGGEALQSLLGRNSLLTGRRSAPAIEELLSKYTQARGVSDDAARTFVEQQLRRMRGAAPAERRLLGEGKSLPPFNPAFGGGAPPQKPPLPVADALPRQPPFPGATMPPPMPGAGIPPPGAGAPPRLPPFNPAYAYGLPGQTPSFAASEAAQLATRPAGAAAKAPAQPPPIPPGKAPAGRGGLYTGLGLGAAGLGTAGMYGLGRLSAPPPVVNPTQPAGLTGEQIAMLALLLGGGGLVASSLPGEEDAPRRRRRRV
jgi:hypothetical protein